MMNSVIGILAHVDAGKTTLSEQVLFHAGVLRTPGRVDHGNAFLDAHPLERQRGITIFSDHAVFERDRLRMFWVDTPGHADFAAEMERSVSILDMAVLVIDGTEGIQSHTETIWSLLEAYHIPVLLFVNKTDRPAFDAVSLLAALKQRLSPDIADLCSWHGGPMPESLIETVAVRDEMLLDRLLSDGYDPDLWIDGLSRQLHKRAIFPVCFGSALNDTGVTEFLDVLSLLAVPLQGERIPVHPVFDALVYKVRRDAQGVRLCFFKVLSGNAFVRQEVYLPNRATTKLNELRLYNGARFQSLQEAETGMLCAVPSLPDVRPGDHIRSAVSLPQNTTPASTAGSRNPFHIEPMLAASVICPNTPVSKSLEALRQLEDEDPSLSVVYSEAKGSIDLKVMGPIQLEIIRQLLLERFGIEADFGPMRVLYMETIDTPAVGVGHYEPLRHYAEVQLRLCPGPRGSGITFESLCHVDELALNWQRLIETHVFEKVHKGVLTGAPLTDVKVQLLHGRAHLKHTEGGDFRQSTYRAIRNALMYAHSVLLEPICRFTLRGPRESYSRVMSDLTRMHAAIDPPAVDSERFILTGEAEFALFSAYNTSFLAATRGHGTLSYRLEHYAPCREPEPILEAAAYNPLTDDTPDSVFCAHGAGYTVPWNEVKAHAHCPVEAGK